MDPVGTASLAETTSQESLDVDDETETETLLRLTALYDFKYQLRNKPRESEVLVNTLDEDESGTYDPTQKQPAPSPKRPREYVDDGYDSTEEDRPKRVKVNTWRLGRQTGNNLTVTLKLSSEAGKALLATHQGQSSHHGSSPPPGACSTWSGLPDPREIDCPWGASGYAMRSRAQNAQTTFAIPGALSTPDDGRPGDFPQPTLGHPEARGCRACLALRIPCPLLEDDSTFPCWNCVEDDCDCELVISPTKKRACEACRKVRVRCSYRDGGDHSLPCLRCQEKGMPCCAGPERATERPEGARLFEPSPERPYLSCTACRKTKKRCSLVGKYREPPCKACAAEGSLCTFERVEKLGRAKRRAELLSEASLPQTALAEPAVDEHLPITNAIQGVREKSFRISLEPKAEQSQAPRLEGATSELPLASSGGKLSAESGPAFEAEKLGADTGTVKTIKTRFAHPISFNYDPPQDGSEPCHWCSNTSFGILAFQELKAEVIQWADRNLGYTEVSGGHVEGGAEPSRMCRSCTQDRVRIISCTQHHVCKILELDQLDFNFDTAWEELEPDAPATAPDKATRWCMICPSPAFWYCPTSEQPAGAAIKSSAKTGGEPVESAPVEPEAVESAPDEPEIVKSAPTTGCGLLLCAACAVILDIKYHGQLDHMLSALARRLVMADYPLGLRADAWFLWSRGELWRRLRLASSERNKPQLKGG